MHWLLNEKFRESNINESSIFNIRIHTLLLPVRSCCFLRRAALCCSTLHCYTLHCPAQVCWNNNHFIFKIVSQNEIQQFTSILMMHSTSNLTNWESISYLIAWHAIPTNPRTKLNNNSCQPEGVYQKELIIVYHELWNHDLLYYCMIRLFDVIKSEFTKLSAILKLEMSISQGWIQNAALMRLKIHWYSFVVQIANIPSQSENYQEGKNIRFISMHCDSWTRLAIRKSSKYHPD
jgi:hypothetical protein